MTVSEFKNIPKKFRRIVVACAYKYRRTDNELMTEVLYRKDACGFIDCHEWVQSPQGFAFHKEIYNEQAVRLNKRLRGDLF